MIRCVKPIVGGQIVIGIVIINHTAESRVRIQLAIGTNQSLSVGNVIHVVLQTVALTANHVVNSPYISLRVRVALRKRVILKSSEVCFVVLRGIFDIVVILLSTRIGTKFYINRNFSLTGLSTLGGYENNTVCTTRTIKSCRGSILKNCHILDIVGVYSIHTAAKGGAVDYHEGVVSRINRGNTANTDCRRIRTGSARSVAHLHTGHLAFKSIKRVGHLSILKRCSIDYSSRTRKRSAGRLTICHSNHFIKKFRVGM